MLCCGTSLSLSLSQLELSFIACRRLVVASLSNYFNLAALSELHPTLASSDCALYAFQISSVEP